jgi:hypothetical protein
MTDADAIELPFALQSDAPSLRLGGWRNTQQEPEDNNMVHQ